MFVIATRLLQSKPKGVISRAQKYKIIFKKNSFCLKNMV